MVRGYYFLIACLVIACMAIGCSSKDAEIEIFDGSIRDDQTVGALTNASNQFAFELFGQLDETKNVCVSPYSVSSALSMSMLGAGGATLQEMQKVLGVGDVSMDNYHAAQGRLLAALNNAGSGDGLALNVANRIWFKSGATIQKSFLDRLASVYDAEPKMLDFGQPQGAAAAINRWVAEVTHDRIPSSIEASDLSRDTVLVLTNADYFKAAWRFKFDQEATADGEFQTLTATVTVPFMSHDLVNVRNGWADGVSTLELPYRGGSISMVLLVPQKDRFSRDSEPEETPAEGLARLEKLVARRFGSWYADMDYADLPVVIPRFRFEQKERLRPALERLGMKLSFSPTADFSGISATETWLDDVIHATFIDVNEEGTEAAAVTHNPHVKSERLPSFVANRPFLFVIRENSTGLILFMGRVVDPSAR